MIELYFTNDEMVDFLQKREFNIKTIKTWRSYNTYHNQVEDSTFDTVVAFKDRLDVYNSPDGSYRDDSVEQYKLKSVFISELKKKLLMD